MDKQEEADDDRGVQGRGLHGPRDGEQQESLILFEERTGIDFGAQLRALVAEKDAARGIKPPEPRAFRVQSYEAENEKDGRQLFGIAIPPSGPSPPSVGIFLEFREGEPEDAKLSRDFKDVRQIPRLLELAHAAGARGEPFVLLPTEKRSW